ncbi:MAG: hypothetical protein OQK04_19535 [Kangiellaceae bacterium]|nr:hypothetical protein [Kangiellaceae bacterium]MCW9000913.1 hypothetical protein [Kangiellaceae bacterium]
MKLDDLKRTWTQEVEALDGNQDLGPAIEMLEKETISFDKKIKRRDFIETFAAVICIPAWLYGLAKADHWMEITGLIILLLACIFIPVILWKTRVTETDKLVGIKSFLLNEKAKVKRQISLLSNIVVWYIAPIFSGVMLLTLGANINADGQLQLGTHMWTYYGFVFILSIGIYLLNKQGVKKKFKPILEKIENQLNELERAES